MLNASSDHRLMNVQPQPLTVEQIYSLLSPGDIQRLEAGPPQFYATGQYGVFIDDHYAETLKNAMDIDLTGRIKPLRLGLLWHHSRGEYMPATNAALPPPWIYVLSLYPIYRQLQQTLRRLDNYSDEFAACVLHGCAMYVLNMNRTWVETPPLDDLYTRVSLGANISMEEAAKLCRDLDTDIGAIVFHHLPELGRPDLLELKNYEFIHDHDLKLELQYRIPLLPAPDASSAPVRDPGAGLPGSV